MVRGRIAMSEETAATKIQATARGRTVRINKYSTTSTQNPELVKELIAISRLEVDVLISRALELIGVSSKKSALATYSTPKKKAEEHSRYHRVAQNVSSFGKSVNASLTDSSHKLSTSISSSRRGVSSSQTKPRTGPSRLRSLSDDVSSDGIYASNSSESNSTKTDNVSSATSTTSKPERRNSRIVTRNNKLIAKNGKTITRQSVATRSADDVSGMSSRSAQNSPYRASRIETRKELTATGRTPRAERTKTSESRNGSGGVVSRVTETRSGDGTISRTETRTYKSSSGGDGSGAARSISRTETRRVSTGRTPRSITSENLSGIKSGGGASSRTEMRREMTVTSSSGRTPRSITADNVTSSSYAATASSSRKVTSYSKKTSTSRKVVGGPIKARQVTASQRKRYDDDDDDDDHYSLQSGKYSDEENPTYNRGYVAKKDR